MPAHDPVSTGLLELLADGRDHDRDDLVARVAWAVPPGKGVRRNRSATLSAPTPAQVAAGARSVVLNNLKNLVYWGTVVRDPATGAYRLGPGR